MEFDHFYAVIMAGGGGTRLWPLSRSSNPKQMLALGNERTLFQQAFDRLQGIFPPEHILVVTVSPQADKLRKQVPSIPFANFIIEPFPRGTASVVGLAAMILNQQDPEAIMAVLTADHIIGNTELFHQVLTACYQAAMQNHLVTIGVPPSYPSSGYGYLERGNPSGTYNDIQAFEVNRFKEKPDPETARHFLESGNHDWNSGMFFWKTGTILKEFQRQMPKFYQGLQIILGSWGTNEAVHVLQKIWAEIESQTIDFGIMENAHEVIVIPAPELNWSDVGSWDSLFDVFPGDEKGNIILTTNPLSTDSQDSLFYESNPVKLIATFGVENTIVIDTPDALLICPRGSTQKVRELVNKLKEEGYLQYL